jgi:allophanate hydrolase subunit 2
MFDIIQNGIARTVTRPVFGQQDVGVTPGGPMDRFSFETGHTLLGNRADATALEVVLAPELKFTRDVHFVLTGAMHDSVVLTWPADVPTTQKIDHATVYFAPAGSTLKFGGMAYGFRAYLCCRAADKDGGDIRGRRRGDFAAVATWPDPGNCIRVVEGPEYRYLDNPSFFTDQPWKITQDVSDMGMRLTCSGKMPTVSLKNMVSEAVSNGTVQLTPKGPIILLKYRQTVGGYPRIFNVISADVDILGQYAPDQIVRFKKVSIDQAIDVAQKKKADIEKLKDRFGA